MTIACTTVTDLIDVLEASPIGAVILDEQDRVLFWNTRLLDILGGLQGDAFAMAAASAFFAEPRDFEAAKQSMSENGVVRGIEARILRADGLEAWAAVTMGPMAFEGQRATLVWYYDITASKLREKALELSQETLLAVLDAAPIGVALIDGPGRVSYWNAAMMDVIACLHDIEPADAIRHCIDLATEAIVQSGDGHPFRLGDREQHWVMAWRRQVMFEHQPAALIWFHDVTALHNAQIEAEQAVRAKSAFLATMSHEIRTPMNGVHTLADLLADTRLDADQARMVATIRESADALITVINDILDFSKIEAGKLDVDIHPFQLKTLVAGVTTLLRPKAEERGLRLELSTTDNLVTWRLGDAMRIRQILLNLLGNAIKFTERGQVALRIAFTGIQVRFEVADTGIGIPSHRLPDLFAPFRQVEASTARRFGGTGLGLSICKGLVELMGGLIGVHSVPGQGSLFWFELPLPVTDAVPEEETTTARPRYWQPPSREEAARHQTIVLCADDNPTNRDVLARVLDRLGVVFDITEDGTEALARLDRAIHGLVLADGHMPGLDGWELTMRIRYDEVCKGLERLPIIALTADAVRGVEEKCFEAGMDGYLTKPLVVNQIERALLQHLPSIGALRQPLEGRPDQTQPTAVFGIESGVLDLEPLADLVADEPDAMDEILQHFMDSAEALATEVLTNFNSPAPETAQRPAHSLKSAARYVGARKLAEAAFAIEQALAERRPDEARRWVPALRPLLDEVAAAIEKLRVEDQLRRIRREIGELAASSEGLRQGLELEAVVGITETAADRILAAAETILSRVDRIGSVEEAEAVQSAVMAIFEACSFQDLTSQRVRKAVAKLSEIEDKLAQVVQGDGETPPALAASFKLAGQAEIDQLFGTSTSAH